MKINKYVLAIFIFVIITNITIPFSACAAEWKTVTTITGSADQTSKTFSITAPEWRLQWSYTPDPDFPSLTFFGVLVYPEGEDTSFIGSFYVNGSTQTSGVKVINGGVGNYHLEVLDANIPNYTIIVEQYGGTIASEDGSSTANITNLVLAVLVIAIFVVAAVIVLLKRRKKLELAQPSFSSPPVAIVAHF